MGIVHEPSTVSSDLVEAAIHAAAQRHFNLSNERGAPQWSRKAHAHAWAGMLEALKIYQSLTPQAKAVDGAQTNPKAP